MVDYRFRAPEPIRRDSIMPGRLLPNLGGGRGESSVFGA
jgi:hypothetical protein